MKSKILVSAVIVAKNEEKNLGDCLNSIKWADEIILFDNDSADKTSKIAQEFGCKVFKTKIAGFSDRKNLSFKKATGSWIFSIDADERVTQDLKEEILNVIKNIDSDFAAYAIPRKNIILGNELKRGWWPDYVIRLFDKNKFEKFSGELHEQPEFNGKLGYLKNPLVHLKHDNLSEMVLKTNDWSDIEAKLMFNAQHPPMNIFRFLSAIAREANLRFIKDRAFLDGTRGIIYAEYQVYSRFFSYAKLWEMQLNKSETRNPNT